MTKSLTYLHLVNATYNNYVGFDRAIMGNKMNNAYDNLKNKEPHAYWFPAKRSGWGWGPPITSAGWVFLASWIILVFFFSSFLVLYNFALFLVFLISMIIILLTVCFIKGEPLK